jgi:hypothetical protein
MLPLKIWVLISDGSMLGFHSLVMFHNQKLEYQELALIAVFNMIWRERKTDSASYQTFLIVT